MRLWELMFHHQIRQMFLNLPKIEFSAVDPFNLCLSIIATKTLKMSLLSALCILMYSLFPTENSKRVCWNELHKWKIWFTTTSTVSSTISNIQKIQEIFSIIYANIIVSYSSLPLAARKWHYMNGIHNSEFKDIIISPYRPLWCLPMTANQHFSTFTLWMVQQ